MEKSKEEWNALAGAWDDRMGAQGNRWHKELVLPGTLKFLDLKKVDRVLEIACGSGHFADRISDHCAQVFAFDFSEKMIEAAEARWSGNNKITFEVLDATNYEDMKDALQGQHFTKIVSNMAIMDISDIEPMFRLAGEILGSGGVFVFSSIHPCFQNPGMQITAEKGVAINEYINESMAEDRILANSELTATQFHRPLSQIVNLSGKNKMLLESVEEPVFPEDESCTGFQWSRIPPVIIYKAKKL